MVVLQTVVGIVLLVIVGVLAWSAIEPYTIDRQSLEVTLPHLPDAWDGRVVAVIADTQVGMRLANISTIRRIVAELVERRPAVVLMAGDFVYEAQRDPEGIARRSAELLAPLVEAGLPVYAVLGNHDYAMPSRDVEPDERVAEAVWEAAEGVGIRMLENETLPLTLPEDGEPRQEAETLYLAAIGAHVPGRDRPVETLAQLPAEAARIVMMHHPDSFDALSASTAPLAVAGHTHGGQFRIPFTPQWTWMTFTEDDTVHPSGWIPDFGAEGNRLYVNRGIGFSVLPLRLNAPPEITYLTLRKPAAESGASTP
ncbi:MAG: metallophosphoesterase [Trueperaceae bacterium]|nr:metallophosphoesterase [Trueperaceae bacterium]